MNYQETEWLRRKVQHYPLRGIPGYEGVEEFFIASRYAGAYRHFILLYQQLLNLYITLQYFQKEELAVYTRLNSAPGHLFARRLEGCLVED